MYLISKGMYEADHRPKEDIIIDPCDDSLFTANCYYFRLGALYERGEPVPMVEPLTLQPRERRIVFSMETFSLTSRVFALIGPCSELFLDDILLHNSPTIDPGFSGSLQMVIENQTEKTVTLEIGRKIGKAVFFDIGDTALDLHLHVQQREEMVRRELRAEAGRRIRETAAWVEKSIDTERPKNI